MRQKALRKLLGLRMRNFQGVVSYMKTNIYKETGEFSSLHLCTFKLDILFLQDTRQIPHNIWNKKVGIFGQIFWMLLNCHVCWVFLKNKITWSQVYHSSKTSNSGLFQTFYTEPRSYFHRDFVRYEKNISLPSLVLRKML